MAFRGTFVNMPELLATQPSLSISGGGFMGRWLRP